MPGLYSRIIRPIHLAGDIVIITSSFLISYVLVFGSIDNFLITYHLALLFYYIFTWFLTSFFLGVYQLYRVTGFIGIYINLSKAFFVYAVLIVAFNGAVTALGYSRLFIISSISLSYFAIIFWRLASYLFLRYYRRIGYNFRKVVIAGYNEASMDLYEFFHSHPEHGYRFMAFFDDKEKLNPMVQGKIADIETYCESNDIDEIYCLSSALTNQQLEELIDYADKKFLRIKLIPDNLGLKFKNFKLDLYGELPVVSVRNIPLDDNFNRILKRSFDIFFSFLVCVLLLSWLIPVLAIIIKIDSRGPVFFRQMRSGLNNKDFLCFKLRTMLMTDDAHIKQARKDDTRITKIGRFLRKTSLDELPQFFNVLIGNMSVVGPRPHMLKHTEEYSLLIEKYMLRHLIKPGITGLSQVMGYRGETEDAHKMHKRVQMDIYYIENWTFLMDVRIVLQTVWNMFKGEENAA